MRSAGKNSAPAGKAPREGIDIFDDKAAVFEYAEKRQVQDQEESTPALPRCHAGALNINPWK
jgi:hypothetical protein